jgi:hypothetical protein
MKSHLFKARSWVIVDVMIGGHEMIVSCLENIMFLAIKRQLAVDRWRFSARVIVGGTKPNE